MVVDPRSNIVFRQALDSRGVEVPRVSVADKTGVGQPIKSEVRKNRLVDVRHRVRIRGSTWLSGSGKRISTHNSNRRLPIGPDPARRRRRHQIAERVALVLSDSFVIGEDEGLILSDRTPAGGSKLVAMEWRQSSVEVVSCVKCFFADEPVGSSVELVAA